MKICRDITIDISNATQDLKNECIEISKHVSFDNSIRFVESGPNQNYDAILNVGTKVLMGVPCTVINSNGWLLRISSTPGSIAGDCDNPNPVASLAAASLGVAEVFKQLIRIKPSRARLFNRLTLSLLSYQLNIDDPGPFLPTDIPIGLLQVGAGAIGNGVISLLAELPISGIIYFVDQQRIEEENLGTHLLVGPSDIGKSKAEFAASAIANKGVTTTPFTMKFEEFLRLEDTNQMFPNVIISCLDNIRTRHMVQDLWPDIVIDGAVGDFLCQASTHPWNDNIACLRCMYREFEGPVAEEIQSSATGLSINRVQAPLDYVIEDDVISAPPDKQEWLRDKIGRQICSVIEEGVANQISEEHLEENFQPVVPFVATFSAAMEVSELLKHVMDIRSSLAPRFQIDILTGPEFALELPQMRRDDCLCVTRKENIEKIRASRKVKFQTS